MAVDGTNPSENRSERIDIVIALPPRSSHPQKMRRQVGKHWPWPVWSPCCDGRRMLSGSKSSPKQSTRIQRKRREDREEARARVQIVHSIEQREALRSLPGAGKRRCERAKEGSRAPYKREQNLRPGPGRERPLRPAGDRDKGGGT